jgi:hypothetical protein
MLQKYTFIMTCREPGAVRGFGGAEAHGLLKNPLPWVRRPEPGTGRGIFP